MIEAMSMTTLPKLSIIIIIIKSAALLLQLAPKIISGRALFVTYKV